MIIVRIVIIIHHRSIIDLIRIICTIHIIHTTIGSISHVIMAIIATHGGVVLHSSSTTLLVPLLLLLHVVVIIMMIVGVGVATAVMSGHVDGTQVFCGAAWCGIAGVGHGVGH